MENYCTSTSLRSLTPQVFEVTDLSVLYCCDIVRKSGLDLSVPNCCDMVRKSGLDKWYLSFHRSMESAGTVLLHQSYISVTSSYTLVLLRHPPPPKYQNNHWAIYKWINIYTHTHDTLANMFKRIQNTSFSRCKVYNIYSMCIFILVNYNFIKILIYIEDCRYHTCSWHSL